MLVERFYLVLLILPGRNILVMEDNTLCVFETDFIMRKPKANGLRKRSTWWEILKLLVFSSHVFGFSTGRKTKNVLSCST